MSIALPVVESPFAQAARSYISNGPVVPIEFGDKRPPAGVGWKGAAAICHTDQLAQFNDVFSGNDLVDRRFYELDFQSR